jgi:hypothetical protein
MATKQYNKWSRWVLIGVITLALISLVFLVFTPSKDSQLSKNQEQQELSNSGNQQTSSLAGKPLKDALNLLAKQFNITITIDNPYMDNCPFPTLQTNEKSSEEILNILTRQFKMELHKVSSDEYILIGGTCN